MDLNEVESTMRALIWSQAAIGAAVLLVLGVVGYAVVHRSLQPLAEVEETAAAIAAGELDRRVPQRDPRTEVGRLSLALNGMLAQIQRALASSEQSAELARESEERMRRFIGDASHDLRTPLTTIRGYAELYRQGATRDTDMLMGRIESEAGRMGLLVEDLLLLARLDEQRPLDQGRVDLLALATDAVHDAQTVAPARRIRMEVFDGPGIPEVLGDEARLRQVFSNLMSNALQHTPQEADITVRVGTDDRRRRARGVRSGARHETPRTRSGSSSGSTARTPHAPAPAAGSASACRSSTRWWPRMAARCRCSPHPVVAPGSGSACPASSTWLEPFRRRPRRRLSPAERVRP